MKTKHIIIFGIAGFVGFKTMVAWSLKHFKLSEFRGMHVFLSYGVLINLDAFREALMHPVIISPAPGSIVRFDTGEESDHLYGRGLDVMIPNISGKVTPSLETCYIVAKAVGFNAIGVYPFWKPYKGLHLGVRYPSSKLSTWSDLSRIPGKHEYAALGAGLVYG